MTAVAGQKKVAIVGGGHNSLVAATLLARAGVTVTVFEKGATLGGAAVSARPFAGVDVKVSPYAYLVSLFPSDLLASLGVSVELRSRRVAWCAPDGDVAVVRGRSDGEATARSFAAAGLAGDLAALERWDRAVGRIAGTLAPTFLRPLRPAEEIRGLLGEEAWGLLCRRPLG
ncbi:MAG: NAD(P)-binding protein, partial [Acidobacteriota bacterium]|nr:NAD(P)-binding protein [Acidobacteriota bacterium]